VRPHRLLPGPLRRRVRRLLARSGYEVKRVRGAGVVVDQYRRPSFDVSTELPEGAGDYLRPDNPRLAELRKRYAAADSPMSAHSVWTGDYLRDELDLPWFRGDNSYVYQFRNLGSDARMKYYVYLRDLATRDPADLLQRLGEDGRFGCWTFHYEGWPRVSRDLLDSINELYFLDRRLQLLSHRDWTVLDIGAGYGRLAHRATSAVPGIVWLCADAVPESSFLCEYYLRHRGVTGAHMLPLDEIDARLSEHRIDLAVNVHSFSETTEQSVRGWLDLLVKHHVPRLFVVPNDGDRLLTREPDRTRRPIDPLLAERGYTRTACEPIFLDRSMPRIMGMDDHFLLYERLPREPDGSAPSAPPAGSAPPAPPDPSRRAPPAASSSTSS